MVMLQAPSLTPRDLNSLATLKKHGVFLVEVKISQVSYAKGKLLSSIVLPDHTRIVAVLRNGKAILELDAVFIEEKDSIYLLTDDESLVRRTFTV